jgi:hypothetical protein
MPRAGSFGGDEVAFLVEAERRGGDSAALGDLADGEQLRQFKLTLA